MTNKRAGLGFGIVFLLSSLSPAQGSAPTTSLPAQQNLWEPTLCEKIGVPYDPVTKKCRAQTAEEKCIELGFVWDTKCKAEGASSTWEMPAYTLHFGPAARQPETRALESTKCEFPFVANKVAVAGGGQERVLQAVRVYCGPSDNPDLVYDAGMASPWRGCAGCGHGQREIISSTCQDLRAGTYLIGVEVWGDGDLGGMRPICGDPKTAAGEPRGGWIGTAAPGSVRKYEARCPAKTRMVGLNARAYHRIDNTGVVCAKFSIGE